MTLHFPVQIRVVMLDDGALVLNPSLKLARRAPIEVLYAGTADRATLLQV